MRYSQLLTDGVVPKGGRAAVRGQHRILQRVGGVVGVAAGDLRQPVQLPVVAVEQFLEGVPVTRDVRGEQLGIAALVSAIPQKLPTAEH